jgi:hypothetical protein
MREELSIEVLKATKIANAVLRYTDGRDVLLRFHIYEVAKYSGVITNREPRKHSRFTYLSLLELGALEALSDATLLFLASQGVIAKASWAGEVVNT